MKSLRAIIVLFLAALCTSNAQADEKHIQWTARLEPADARAGESAQIVLTAKLDHGWHVYSLTTPDGGPLKTTISLKPGSALKAEDKPVQPAFTKKHDDV